MLVGERRQRQDGLGFIHAAYISRILVICNR